MHPFDPKSGNQPPLHGAEFDPDDISSNRAASHEIKRQRDNADAQEQQPHWRQLLTDMTGWRCDNAPDREWAVRDCIPLRQPALFSGEGAIGKSLIEMQLC